MIKGKLSFILIGVLAFGLLSGCQQRFQPLPNSPSYIIITRFHMDVSHLQTVKVTGKRMTQLYKGLNASGKHIVPKNAVFSCPAARAENSWTYDIVIHYPTNVRLFVLSKEGCTFIKDSKDDLILYPTTMPDLSNYFES